MDSSMDEVFTKHLSAARDEVASAQAMIDAGRAKITEGQEQVLAGEAAADAARTRLAVVEDLVAKVRRDLDAITVVTTGTAAAAAAPATTAEPATSATQQSHSNGGRSMGPVMDEIMADGEWRTIDSLFAAMQSRGHAWSRGSVMNRCADRAKRGEYERLVRGDGKSLYKLAADSGDQLPSGPASPEGRREPQPEGDSRNGSGQVQEAGSLAI